jgi:nonribosomal peptide synthetase DhbF
MSSLEADYPIYGLQARGIGKKEPLPQSLDDMAADYIEKIRTVQPKGPYRLLGWSLGGNVIQALSPVSRISDNQPLKKTSARHNTS